MVAEPLPGRKRDDDGSIGGSRAVRGVARSRKRAVGSGSAGWSAFAAPEGHAAAEGLVAEGLVAAGLVAARPLASPATVSMGREMREIRVSLTISWWGVPRAVCAASIAA
eukprot:2937448-Prymnesium_polylepis.1